VGIGRTVIVETRVGSKAQSEPGHTTGRSVYLDVDGAVVTDPTQAVRGEIVEDAGTGNAPRRTWFRIEEVELDWLPVRESAFLLWVLVVLAAVWFGIGLLLLFT
jgi:hypothetical protein